jgi:hypothetical protein
MVGRAEMTTQTNFVPFDELPVLPGCGLRHSWDVFGSNDELGTINRLTPSVVAQAVASVRSGERVSMSLPLEFPEPPLFGRKPFTHSVFSPGRNTWDDNLDGFYPQASTQWDGLRHIRAREDGFYGGWQGDPDKDESHLGIQNWARVGIVGRGLLVDMYSWSQQSGSDYDPFATVKFDPSDIKSALSAQGVQIQPGDILCFRFGWIDKYLSLDVTGRNELSKSFEEVANRIWAGLSGSEEMSRYLWNSGAAAVVCDNPAVEVAPGDPALGSLHRRLIPCLGFALGELFDFSLVATTCKSSGRSDFLFVSVPLNLLGGVGSPGSAVAIF